MVTAKPCLSCGEATYMSDRICAVCTDPPHDSGRFTCCGGMFPEHFPDCTVGQAIRAARRRLARAQLHGRHPRIWSDA